VNQKFSAPATKDLLNIAGSNGALNDTVIKALLKVSPPRVLFEGLSRRTVDYDSDQIARSLKFPRSFVKPSAGIKTRRSGNLAA